MCILACPGATAAEVPSPTKQLLQQLEVFHLGDSSCPASVTSASGLTVPSSPPAALSQDPPASVASGLITWAATQQQGLRSGAVGCLHEPVSQLTEPSTVPASPQLASHVWQRLAVPPSPEFASQDQLLLVPTQLEGVPPSPELVPQALQRYPPFQPSAALPRPAVAVQPWEWPPGQQQPQSVPPTPQLSSQGGRWVQGNPVAPGSLLASMPARRREAEIACLSSMGWRSQPGAQVCQAVGGVVVGSTPHQQQGQQQQQAPLLEPQPKRSSSAVLRDANRQSSLILGQRLQQSTICAALPGADSSGDASGQLQEQAAEAQQAAAIPAGGEEEHEQDWQLQVGRF